uniref:Acyltransferase n=1 Tax=Solanum tuberosum TaxID=4113 RepID=M1CHW5_SOLTU
MASSTILSRKIIKPSPSIPSSHRHYNLSFRDQTANTAYLPIAALYSKPENHTITQISNILENSLSKTLFFYYPLAGRIKDNKYVDCNDIVGAEYFNVRVNCQMSEILTNPYNDGIEIVFPQNLPWSDSLSKERSSLVVVQLSHFDCGGVGVGICVSHKIADGYSACKFLSDWISMARDHHELNFQPSPQFDGALFFPPIDNPPPMPNGVPGPQRCVSRMYNFSLSSLFKLKDIVSTNSQIKNPSRIEVATSLLHKCGVDVSMTKLGVFKPTMLFHVMNLRPPIPLNTMGNANCHFSTIAMTENKISLPNYVGELQKAKQQLRYELKDMNTDQLATHAIERIKEIANIMKQDAFDMYFCTSLCTFGSHKIDFGWGTPIRVTQVKQPMKNQFIFMDDPSGEGINVLITLTEADMLLFQNNKDLLEFASPVVQSLE